MATIHKHWAYCPQTGECLSSATGNALKRHLRRHLARDIRWAQAHPEDNLGRRQWIFSHNADAGILAKLGKGGAA